MRCVGVFLCVFFVHPEILTSWAPTIRINGVTTSIIQKLALNYMGSWGYYFTLLQADKPPLITVFFWPTLQEGNRINGSLCDHVTMSAFFQNRDPVHMEQVTQSFFLFATWNLLKVIPRHPVTPPEDVFRLQKNPPKAAFGCLGNVFYLLPWNHGIHHY